MGQLNYNARKKNAKKVRNAWEKMNRNAMKFEKFMKIAIDYGVDPEFFSMDEVKQITEFVNARKHFVGYNYQEGDNSNRERGFKHNPYHTLKGKFYQNTIKPLIRKAIYAAHAYWLSKYDDDAFVYDDPRLKSVDEFTKTFIDEHVQDAAYKTEFMHMLRDIVCGMVKEDPYYTSMFWMFCNRFIKEYPDGFEMTEAEIENWERVHNG